MTNITLSDGHALIIGVGADLPITVQDAKALNDVLVDPSRTAYPPKQVDLLTEAKANRRGILLVAGAVLRSVARGDAATYKQIQDKVRLLHIYQP